MAGIEIEEDYLRDAIVDVGAGRGIGVNGLNLTQCHVDGGTVRIALSSPFSWSRQARVVFRRTKPSRTYKIYVNGIRIGVWRGDQLEKGILATPARG
jgi:hypothetical protein